MKKRSTLFLSLTFFLGLAFNLQAQDANKDGFHDQDVEVLENILLHNNTSNMLGWQGPGYLSYKGIKWNNSIPKRLISIDIRYKNLTGVLDISNCSELSNIDCSYNKVTKLNIDNNDKLSMLACQFNQISKLNVVNTPVLRYFFCDNNNLPFSELEKMQNILVVDYGKQNLIFTKNLIQAAPFAIDYSSEEIIKEINSVFTWYKDEQKIEGATGAKYTATEPGNYYCKIMNTAYLGLILTTNTISITEESNNYPPTIATDEITIALGTKPETLIDKLQIIDQDYPSNRVLYDLKDNLDFFSIDQEGLIYLINPIDYSSISSYSITVKLDDNKHPIIEKEIKIIFQNKDTDKDSFHDDDVKVLQNILKNNNQEQSLSWQGADYENYTGVTWNDNNPRRITKINIYNTNNKTKLTGNIDFSPCAQLTELNCSYHAIEKIDVSKNFLLKSLACPHNNLNYLDLENNSNLRYISCLRNKLDSINIPKSNNLINLYCSHNKLTYSQLNKVKSIFNLDYGEQYKVFGEKELNENTTINYSKEEWIRGAQTTYAWYKDNVLYRKNNEPILTPTELGVYYCIMTNVEFNNLTLTTNNITVIETNSYPTSIAIDQTLNIDENSNIGNSLGIVKTYDKDPSTDKVFYYTDDINFEIDEDTGELTLKSQIPLDFELNSSIDITISIDDKKHPIINQKVLVKINDINEAPTEIALLNNSIAENAPLGTEVGTLLTTDQDANQTFTYTMVENEFFELVEGQIISKKEFDFETDAASYDIELTVADQDGLTLTQTLTINLTDVNDAPTAIQVSANTIVENAAIGTEVGILTASDVDVNQSFTYSIADNENFEIVGDKLLSKDELDYEAQDSYSLEITVTDQGGLSFKKDFSLQIVNVNEAPVFTSEAITIGTEAVEYVYTVEYMDIDEDAISLLAIEKPEWLSLLDNGDGTCTLSGTPVRGGLYHVTLEASDSEFTVQQEFDIEVEVVTGIEPDFTACTLSIYPNPVVNELHIDLSNFKEQELSIALYSLTGKLIFKESYQSIGEEVSFRKSLQHLQSGMYLLMIENDGSRKTYKIVKK